AHTMTIGVHKTAWTAGTSLSPAAVSTVTAPTALATPSAISGTPRARPSQSRCRTDRSSRSAASRSSDRTPGSKTRPHRGHVPGRSAVTPAQDGQTQFAGGRSGPAAGRGAGSGGDVGPPAEPGSGDMGAPWGGAGSVGWRRGTPPLLDRVEWESNPTRAPLEASECGDGTWWYPRNAAGGVRGGRARRPR